MIKIKSVEIDGFITPSQKVKLNFVDSNVICIYGDNGSGKTSFLEILFAVFDRNERVDKNNERTLDKYKVNRVVIEYVLSSEENIIEKISIGKDIDANGQEYYNFDMLENSEFKNVSSLFLGIGRGIHKNELKIPKAMLWHFFRTNKKINDNSIEIDEITDELAEYLTPKDRDSDIEDYRARELDDKKNIYLSNIEIDTIEAFLNIKYQEAVLDAKERIEKSLAQTSLKFLQSSVTFDKKIDFQDLKEKLLYNKSLLLEMFNDDNIGIMTLLDNLEKNENYLEQIDKTQQKVLVNIILELQSEVELWHEIKHFLEEYNKFLNYNKKLVFSSNGVFVAPDNHSIQRLSSGERHLLTFLATILLMGEEQDFILLDEPEISLNVDWQRKILSTIASLAPNSQIIVATHSPLIGRSYRKSVVGLEPKVIDDEE